MVLEKKADVKCMVKWPNDLYIFGRKVCGILTEMIAEQDLIRSVVIGVGINVNSERGDFPPDLRESVTTLREETGKVFSRVDIVASVADLMIEHLDMYNETGLEAFLVEWENRSYLEGKMVVVETGDRKLKGIVRGIHPERGFLILERDDGKFEEVISGEIHVYPGD